MEDVSNLSDLCQCVEKRINGGDVKRLYIFSSFDNIGENKIFVAYIIFVGEVVLGAS